MRQHRVAETCAATGKLPNQPSNAARFAPAPKHVRLEEVRDPPEACICTDITACPDLPMFCPDAYTFEVCYFNHVRKNRDALFAIETGEDFLCEFDAEKYRSLKDLLAPPPPPPLYPPPPPLPPPTSPPPTYPPSPPLPSPTSPLPPPPPFYLRARRNCWWDGHGAEEVDSPRGSDVPGARTLAECKAACKSAAASGLPFCEGVLWKRREGKCYRKTRIIVGLCQFDTAFDLRSDLPPPPPPPPDTIPKSVPRSAHSPWPIPTRFCTAACPGFRVGNLSSGYRAACLRVLRAARHSSTNHSPSRDARRFATRIGAWHARAAMAAQRPGR